MRDCGCYDPGFILRLILGAQDGREVNAWLQNTLKEMASLPEVGPLSEKDVVWKNQTRATDDFMEWVTLSPGGFSRPGGLADLSIDANDPQGYRQLLEQFLIYLKQPVRLLNLVFQKPTSDAAGAHIHLTIRLLRAILLKLQAGAFLLPDQRGSDMDKSSFWGNTLNEAHLVYNEELPRILARSLASGDSTELNQWAATLKLPGTNVAYFNFLPSDLFSQTGWYYPALVVTLSISGLPGLDGLKTVTDQPGLSRLLQARRECSVFHPASAQMVVEVAKPIFALLKISPDALMMSLCLVNLSSERVVFKPDTAALGLPESGWTDLISRQPVTILKGQPLNMDGYSAMWLCQPV
jgi:hypothetical protein